MYVQLQFEMFMNYIKNFKGIFQKKNKKKNKKQKNQANVTFKHGILNGS